MRCLCRCRFVAWSCSERIRHFLLHQPGETSRGFAVSHEPKDKKAACAPQSLSPNRTGWKPLKNGLPSTEGPGAVEKCKTSNSTSSFIGPAGAGAFDRKSNRYRPNSKLESSSSR